MLELIGVEKSFWKARALETTTLKLTPGATTVLIGPSGCGKSTLLRLMIGLIPPDAGEVRFDGARLASDTVASVRRRTGYVIQGGGLFPHLTAAENAALMAGHLGWSKTRMRRRLDELAQLTKLSADLLERFPAQLSGGQRQRVSLIRALMLDPDALLLDEPLGALDPLIRCDLQDDLRSVFTALEKTVVLVTHDLAEAAFFADEIVLMRSGSVVQRGPLSALRDEPAHPFVTRFLEAQRRTHELADRQPARATT